MNNTQIRIYRCRCIGNGPILIVPNHRNFHDLSHGTLYFSVDQIVLVNYVSIYVSGHWPIGPVA